MSDIQLRFHNDMLVLSSPVEVQLRDIGIDTVHNNELTLLLEPEVFHELYALQNSAGAQCLVTDTAFMTPARLTHSRMTKRAEELAQNAIEVVKEHKPQHVLVEIGPCGLPLDPSSKASLNENRDQYSRAAKLFASQEPEIDAYFLNDFESCSDLRCALMGLRKVTDKPIFASVRVGSVAPFHLKPSANETLEDAIRIMEDCGAQVAGFSTGAQPEVACEMVRLIVDCCTLPVLAQLEVREPLRNDDEECEPTPENPYCDPDTMVDAASQLRACGVQFLRACGNATPSYTGALVASTIGDKVVSEEFVPEPSKASGDKLYDSDEMESVAAELRAKLRDALGD